MDLQSSNLCRSRVSCISFLFLPQALCSMTLSNRGWGRGSPTNNQFQNVAMRNPPLFSHTSYLKPLLTEKLKAALPLQNSWEGNIAGETREISHKILLGVGFGYEPKYNKCSFSIYKTKTVGCGGLRGQGVECCPRFPRAEWRE